MNDTMSTSKKTTWLHGFDHDARIEGLTTKPATGGQSPVCHSPEVPFSMVVAA